MSLGHLLAHFRSGEQERHEAEFLLRVVLNDVMAGSEAVVGNKQLSLVKTTPKVSDDGLYLPVLAGSWEVCCDLPNHSGGEVGAKPRCCWG